MLSCSSLTVPGKGSQNQGLADQEQNYAEANQTAKQFNNMIIKFQCPGLSNLIVQVLPYWMKAWKWCGIYRVCESHKDLSICCMAPKPLCAICPGSWWKDISKVLKIIALYLLKEVVGLCSGCVYIFNKIFTFILS